MFIIIKHGDIIDLCDESGILKLFFLLKNPGDYASKFLTIRNTYYICKVDLGAPGRAIRIEHPFKAIVPLLKNPDFNLLDALRTQCDFLERSRIKLLRALEAKRLAELRKAKLSMKLRARAAKSWTKQDKQVQSWKVRRQ